MSARIIADETVYSGWLSLRRLTVRMPDGRPEERHVEDHGSAVAVLPYDPVRGTALLVSLVSLHGADRPGHDARRRQH